MAKKFLTERIDLRVTVEVREALERLAAADERSVGAVVRRLIREGLERENGKVKT